MDFCTDNKKKRSNSDMSLLDNSTTSSKIRKCSTTVNPGTSTQLCHEYLKIRPRVPIRKKNKFTAKTPEKVKINEKENEFEDAENNSTSLESEDDILILSELPKKTPDGEKTSPSSGTKKNGVQSKESIKIDEECPNPLVIHLDDSTSSEGESEESCQSENADSSHYSSAEEVFDLCNPEPKWYIMKSPLSNAKMSPQTNSVLRKKILNKESLKSYFQSQSLLEKAIKRAVPHSDEVSEIPNVREEISEENMNQRKNVKTRSKVKNKSKAATDILIRTKLPLQGKKKKKLFTLKLSQLLDTVNDRNHALYKWRNLLTLKNINKVSRKTRLKILKLLTIFVEVKVVRIN